MKFPIITSDISIDYFINIIEISIVNGVFIINKIGTCNTNNYNYSYKCT